MKKALFSALILVLMSTPFVSNGQSSDTNWVEMMSDPTANFYDVQAAFNNYWKDKPIVKGRGYKQFKRWEAYMEPRVFPSGDLTLPSTTNANYQKWLDENPGAAATVGGGGIAASVSGNWVLMGPIGAPSGSGAGRINFIRFDPITPTTMYVGAPAGGLWKSTNSGASWSTNTDQLAVIGCSDLAIHPTNTQIMYLATGDGDGGDTYSVGVLKSIDGGLTWNTTGLNWAVTLGRTINRLLINPSNPSIIMAFGSSGIWRSTDAGVTWTQPTGTFNGIKDAEFKPGDPNTVYAAGTTFRRSTDGGLNWSASIATGLTGVGRMSIAVTPANSAYVYVLASKSSDNGFNAVIRSTDSGASFTTRMASNATNNILGWDNGSDAGGQGWYDLAIAASPTNAEEIYTGGVNIWKSTNGGTSFTLNAHWYGGYSKPYVHADIHDIVYYPGSGTTVLSGNDGGVFRTTNSGTAWSDVSTNLVIAQQYRIGLSASTSNLLLAGHQDNGTNKYGGGTWVQEIGGDGMDCFIDRTNNNVMYGSLYYGEFRRSIDGGTNWTNIVTGIPFGTQATDWVSAWHQDPVTANTLYAGGRTALYKSTNQGTNWTALGTPTGTGNITEFVIAPSNNQIIYAIKSGSNAVSKSTNGGTSFTAVSSGLPTSVAPTYITVSNTDPNIVFVTYSGYSATNKVFKSTNGGTSWTNLSTGLPNIPVNCVVYSNGLANDPIYVGTDVGVYYRDNVSGGWIAFNTGLPRVPVRDLEIYYPTNRLRAGTYGRGTWDSDLYNAVPSPPTADFVANKLVICEGQSVTFTDISSGFPTSWSWSFTGGTPTSSTSQNPTITYNTPGLYSVTLTATNAQGSDSEVKTNYITVISGVGGALPITEGFVGATFPPTNWTLNNGGNAVTWERSATVGNAPTTGNSAKFDNFNISAAGDIDDLVMPSVTTVGLSTLQLQFDVAYARYDAANYDQLDVLVSDDCGLTYDIVYSKSGTVLATDPDATGSYVPGTWRTETIDLVGYVGNSKVDVIFRNISGWGNNLYIDNVNLTGTGGCNNPTVPTVTASPTSICAGSSSTLTITGTLNDATQWSIYSGSCGGTLLGTTTGTTFVVTPGATTTYYVRGTGGCVTSGACATATVTVNPIPATPTISAGGPTTFCAGGSVTLTSSSATGNQWRLNGTAIGGATSQTYVATASGNYTVIVTASGCSSAASAATTVTVNPIPATPTISAGGPTTFCAGGSVTLTSSSATGNQWRLNGTAIGGATNQTYVVTASGNYTVVVTTSGCASAASAATTVTVNPIPATPTISAGGSTTFCAGGSVTLTSSSATGNQWRLNGTAIGGATNQTYVATASGNYTVIVTASGCSSAASAATTVTVNPAPATPTISAGGPTTFCAGGSVTLTSSSASGNQWYLNGSSIGGATNQTYVATASGNYTVVVTSSGCSSAASAATTVTVNPIPATATISAGGPTTFCAGGSVTLTSSSASGNQWYLNGSSIGGATNQTYVATASGNYTVVVTSSGCSSAASAATTVTVNPAPATPTISAGGPTTFCAGGSVTLTSSSASGNQWYLNGSSIGGATNQTYVATASGNYTVIVTASGCSSVASAATTVTVNPAPATPTISAGGATTFCTGGSVTLTSSSASGNQWYLNGSSIGGATNQTYVATASGNYTVIVTASGCSSAASSATTVTVNPAPATPTISAGGPTTFCAGGSVTLTSSSATGNQWRLNGTAIGGATNQTYVATASGNYTVIVTASGCSSAASAAITVTVNPAPATPTISAGGPTTFCAGGSVTLTSSSASGNQWYLNGSSIGGATNQTYVATASGNYTVIITNGNGCSSAASAATTVTVNPAPVTPTISAGGPTTFCAGGSVTLTSSSASGNQWYLNGSSIGGATNQTYVATASGNYTVVVTTSGCSSAASAATTVTVNPIPATATISAGGPTTFCAGGSVTLTSSSATGNQWRLNGTAIGGATSQTYVATASGNYTVVVTTSGCSSAASAATTVTVNPIPATATISAGGPTTFCAGGSVTLTSSSASGNQWYLNGSSIGGATNQTYVATASGNYTVIVTASGCSSAASAATTITVNPIPSTPTISAGGATTFCAGGSVTLTSSSASGNQWYLNGSSIGGATNQTYVATASGNYTVIVTASGCSSVASAATTVTVNPVPATPTISAGGPTTFCAGGSVTLTSSSASGNQWYLNGSSIGGVTNQTYVATASGSYTVTFTNGNGCSATSGPTVVMLLSPTSGSQSVTTCNSYTWPANGMTYNSSGIYSTVLANAAGCDSTVTLNLTINSSTSGSENVSSCSNYTWPANGMTYNSSGIYTAILTNAAGCDSIATLNLNINSSTSGSESVSSCSNYTWPANGMTYNSSGIYTAILTNTAGCDSIATLNLTINSSTSGSENVSSCSNYTWSANGMTYNSSGIYSTVLVNAVGCDSTVTLNLTINSATSGSENVSACNDYTWQANGMTYTSSGLYTAVLTNSAGCDSTVTLDLTIYQNPVVTFTSIGTYCDNVSDFTLSGGSPAGGTYSGVGVAGGMFSPITAGIGTHTITYTYTTSDGCTGSATSDVIVEDCSSIDDLTGTVVNVYPNPAYGMVNIESDGMAIESVSIYDATGRLVEKYTVSNLNATVDVSEYATGLYNLQIQIGDKYVWERILKQ